VRSDVENSALSISSLRVIAGRDAAWKLLMAAETSPKLPFVTGPERGTLATTVVVASLPSATRYTSRRAEITYNMIMTFNNFNPWVLRKKWIELTKICGRIDIIISAPISFVKISTKHMISNTRIKTHDSMHIETIHAYMEASPLPMM